MLVGYVSDEYFTAISDVSVEFASGKAIVQARSSASGAVVADLDPGTYKVTLTKPGFSAKRTSLTVRARVTEEHEEVHQFRLLSTALAGVCVAQMGAVRRVGRAVRQLRGAIHGRPVALRTGATSCPDCRLLG